MTIYDSPPGAPSADCDVCGKPTWLRRPEGDGHVPLCSDECERAWPRMLALRARVAELEAEIRLAIEMLDTVPTDPKLVARRAGTCIPLVRGGLMGVLLGSGHGQSGHCR